ncbi:MAG: phosphatidate cytidylyltransferase [Anaerolineales bacterium]|jgi:phosphatidate cytidylyltransferase
MAKRILVAFVLLAIGIPAIIFGGLPYFLLILLFIGMAAWEYVIIFRAVLFSPSMWLTVGGVLLLLFVRNYFPAAAGAVLSLLVLAAMALHLFTYEFGRNQAATDFAVTLGGIVYLGWIGAYLLDLRNLPRGFLWLLLVLGTVWLSDAAAYFIGSRFGKHQLSPRLSPKKTWEGFWAGVLVGTLACLGLALLWHRVAGLAVTAWQGAILGLVLSTLPTLGDLGESMIKRQAGFKDSSNIIPGHGGFLDRVDSWLWAAVLGYFLIVWFIL